MLLKTKWVIICTNNWAASWKKWHVRPVNTQISLGIRPVWSESSLSAWRKLGSLATHWAHSEDWSDWMDAQADLSIRWERSHFVCFVMRRLNCCSAALNAFHFDKGNNFTWDIMKLKLLFTYLLEKRISTRYPVLTAYIVFIDQIVNKGCVQFMIIARI